MRTLSAPPGGGAPQSWGPHLCSLFHDHPGGAVTPGATGCLLSTHPCIPHPSVCGHLCVGAQAVEGGASRCASNLGAPRGGRAGHRAGVFKLLKSWTAPRGGLQWGTLGPNPDLVAGSIMLQQGRRPVLCVSLWGVAAGRGYTVADRLDSSPWAVSQAWVQVVRLRGAGTWDLVEWAPVITSLSRRKPAPPTTPPGL